MDQLLTTDTLVDAERIAKMTALTVNSVRRLAREGTIPSFHAGRLWRFSEAEVLEAMRSNGKEYHDHTK